MMSNFELKNVSDDLENGNYGTECLIIRAILAVLRRKGDSCRVGDVISAVVGVIEAETMIEMREGDVRP